jgi:hypothetical protein
LQRVLNNDQRLIEPTVGEQHRLVEDQPNPVAETIWLSRRAKVKVAPPDPFVFLSWIQPVAHGTLRDVPEPAVWALGRLDGSSDVAAVLTGVAQRSVRFADLRITAMSASVQYVPDAGVIIGGKLEIRTTLPITMDTVQWMLGVNPNTRVLDQVVADLVRAPELFGTIGFIDNADLIPGHGTSRLRLKANSTPHYKRSPVRETGRGSDSISSTVGKAEPSGRRGAPRGQTIRREPGICAAVRHFSKER